MTIADHPINSPRAPTPYAEVARRAGGRTRPPDGPVRPGGSDTSAKSLATLAGFTQVAVVIFGLLALIGGLIIAAQTRLKYSPSAYSDTVKTHPYVGYGIATSLAALVWTLVVVCIVRAIRLYAQSRA